MKTLNKTNILTTIAFLFVVSVTIFVGWNEYSMAKKKASGPLVRNTSIYTEYYLDAETDVNQVPDDSKPLLAYIGRFTFEEGSDEPIYIEDGLEPHTFAQRVTNLIFKLDKIPANNMPLRKKLVEIKQAWRIKGNSHQAFFIDYRPKNPDFEAYRDFIGVLKRTDDNFKYNIEQQHVFPVLDNSWISAKKDDYMKLMDETHLALIDPTIEDLQSEEYLEKLDNIGVSFKVKLPVGYENIELDINRLRQNRRYGSSMRIIDKNFVKPDFEIKVGFLPKFLDKELLEQEENIEKIKY